MMVRFFEVTAKLAEIKLVAKIGYETVKGFNQACDHVRTPFCDGG